MLNYGTLRPKISSSTLKKRTDETFKEIIKCIYININNGIVYQFANWTISGKQNPKCLEKKLHALQQILLTVKFTFRMITAENGSCF